MMLNKNMMIASDSPETQNNDAVTKMQTIWWLIVIYFLKTDVIPQSQYIIFIVACLRFRLQWIVLDVESSIFTHL